MGIKWGKVGLPSTGPVTVPTAMDTEWSCKTHHHREIPCEGGTEGEGEGGRRGRGEMK